MDTYNIIATELVPNRVMWGLATQEGLMMFNEKLACAVRVDGGKVGHFECIQLEASRVKRHVYTTSWHDSPSDTKKPTLHDSELLVWSSSCHNLHRCSLAHSIDEACEASMSQSIRQMLHFCHGPTGTSHVLRLVQALLPIPDTVMWVVAEAAGP